MRIQTILSCGVMLSNSADWDCFKTLIFAGDLEDSKFTSGGTLCFRKSHVCSFKLDVSETNFSCAQSTVSEIISLDCRIEKG